LIQSRSLTDVLVDVPERRSTISIGTWSLCQLSRIADWRTSAVFR